VPYERRTEALTMKIKQVREELEDQLNLEIRHMAINGREKLGFSHDEYTKHQASRDMGNFDWFG
jgi:hypothetical protein